jgi:predicted peroxiredoxin
MVHYLLVESRDPFAFNEVVGFFQLAADLARQGNPVRVFLVQNGVLPAREGAAGNAIRDLVRAGVEVLADEFSLRERGIGAERLTEGVRPAALEFVLDRLAAGDRVLWH